MAKRDFNAKKYWASKPVCLVCEDKKVKTGTICAECRDAANFNKKDLDPSQINELKEDRLVRQFGSIDVERSEATDLVKSLVGYLRDCGRSILRSIAILNVADDKKVDFLPLTPDSLGQLLNGITITEQKARDLLYKVNARPKELEIILGTLFIKGEIERRNNNKPLKINAPLLYVKLDGAVTKDGNVVITPEDETVFLNQPLIAKMVQIDDEEELELRFQDLYDAIPELPITLDNADSFIQNLKGTFPEILPEGDNVERFADYDTVEVKKDSVQLCPAHCFIVAPNQEAEGTIVHELTGLAEKMQNGTAVDYLFSKGVSEGGPAVAGHEEKSLEEIFQKEAEENWHDLFPFDLSDTQKKIVQASRENPLTVVSGPPGTGKSYTIAAVIIDHLLAGKRILFASRMEKAIEVVTSWLEEFVGEYSVAMSGKRKSQRALADKIEKLIGPNSPVKKGDDKEIQDLADEYAEIQGRLEKLQKDFTQILYREREWSQVKGKIDELDSHINNDISFPVLPIGKSGAENLKEQIKGAKFLLENKTFFAQLWWAKFSLNRVRSQLGVDENVPIEELIAIAEKVKKENVRREIESELKKFNDVGNVWYKIKSTQEKLKKIAFQILKRILLANLYLIVNNYDKRKELVSFRQALRAANLRRKSALRSEVSTDTLLSTFPCWASTTFHLSEILPLEPGMFDLVVFDEASQCDLASAVPALYRANRALVVGDPKQLTHVVFISRQTESAAFAQNEVPPAAQETYRFTSKSLFDVAESRVRQKDYFMLDEHFRSDPHIISFSNKKFYDDTLRIMTQRPAGGSEADRAIQLEHVDGHRTIGAKNPREIEAVFRHVREVIASSPEDEPTTIGILSPFRDQVDAITKELPQYLSMDEMNKHEIVVGTAHTLQGDEKDVVVASFSVDSDYHHGTLRFLQKPNVFNVSITRAKKKLIVITSVTEDDLPSGLLKEFIEHAKTAPQQKLPEDAFDSEFEKDVAYVLRDLGLEVWPQYEAAGFHIDLVVGNGDSFIAVECDGPSHYDSKGEQRYYDVWRQKILERAGWDFVRISYREWNKDREGSIEKVINALPA